MKKATAVNATTLRLQTKRPFAPIISRLAVGMGIIPKHIHSKLENKKRFGAKPLGSGPYRAISVNKNKGIALHTGARRAVNDCANADRRFGCGARL